MRTRRILVAVALAVLAIANYAESILTKLEFFWRAPQAEAAAARWLTDVDIWLLSYNIEPVIAGLFLTILLSGWVIPDVWPFVKQLFFGASAAAFGVAFRAQNSADARQEFRLGVERAYTKFCRIRAQGKRDETSLVSLVDLTQFPADFPPPEHETLSGYVGSAKWPSEESEVLIRFLKALYETALDADKDPLLPEPQHESFMKARNRVSKFWDHCGREIREGRLTAASIKRQLDSNAHDIKLLAMSELVLSEILPWDVGGGKTNLFFLAKEGSALRKSHRR
jgi:hypothetical protein